MSFPFLYGWASREEGRRRRGSGLQAGKNGVHNYCIAAVSRHTRLPENRQPRGHGFQKRGNGEGFPRTLTFTFRSLQGLHPVRDFLCLRLAIGSDCSIAGGFSNGSGSPRCVCSGCLSVIFTTVMNLSGEFGFAFAFVDSPTHLGPLPTGDFSSWK